MGKDLFPNDYIKDEIDNESDLITYTSMIYPATTFNNNVSMLFAKFNDDDVRDENKRKELLKLTDNTLNFNSSEVSQFIAYGTNDSMVGTEETPKYIEKAKSKNTDIKVIIAEGANHGFGQNYYMNDYINWLKDKLK